MDVRRRNSKPNPPSIAAGEHLKLHNDRHYHTKSSDMLALPLYLTNGLFFTMFFSVAYFLLHRWRDKIRTSTPLHVVTFSEIAAMVALFASVVYLLGFFGIDFMLSLISRPSNGDDAWEVIEEEQIKKELPKHHLQHPKSIDDLQTVLLKEDSRSGPCAAAAVQASNEALLPEEDEEVVKSVVAGATPSYSLEARLGDCKRAAMIRKESVQRMTGRSLEGLPVEGFDYESILGQCCEMPVGYVQIPVGIAGPLLLDCKEYAVPMATTEGCLVASTNRGCKAIYASGGATSFLLRDGMTRAPVVRFPSASRAVQLKFFIEDHLNFDTLSVVFNRFSSSSSSSSSSSFHFH